MFTASKSLVSDFWKNFRETLSVIQWVYDEFADSATVRFYRNVTLWYAIAKLLELTYPWILGFGLTALYAKDARTAGLAMTAIVVTSMLKYVAEWAGGRNIEPFLGQFQVSVDKRINTRFFEKELGLHIEENELLCASVLEKGRAKAFDAAVTLAFTATDAMLTLVITFVILAFLDPFAAFVVLVTIILSALLSAGMNEFVTRNTGTLDDESRAISRYRQERWDSVERVITANKSVTEIAVINQRLRANTLAEWLIWLTYINLTVVRVSLNLIAYSIVAVVGGYSVLYGDMKVTHLLSVLTWTHMVTTQIRMLARAEREITKCVPALKSMRKALELPTKVKEIPNPVSIPEDAPIGIRFQGVSYSYRDGEKVLTNMTFEIRPGERVALIGPSGAGKSTAVRLLQRYMDPFAGNVLVNGVNLRDLRLSSWRDAVAYIPQRPQILDGTMRDNLLYGLPPDEAAKVTDEELMTFMRRFRIDFGKRLVNGVHTRVGKHGLELSGGQAQRVMIGAAVLKKPRFMIIDEATSSLDAESQHDVQEALYELLQQTNAGALIIAHRLSTLRNCDKFVVLRPAETENAEPQVEAVAKSLAELYETSRTFRRLADLEGVTFSRACA
jgi:ABC-type multidrug transport system fused ATPase/permease subunit